MAEIIEDQMAVTADRYLDNLASRTYPTGTMGFSLRKKYHHFGHRKTKPGRP